MSRLGAVLGALLAVAGIAAGAGTAQRAPRHLLLQARRQEQPKVPGFFTEDAVHQAKMPDHSDVPKNKTCHPTCSWSCGPQSACTNKCQPICQPPKCVTACQKPVVSACKQVCQDPQCAVVCPPQCSTGDCPECKTVCNPPNCHLDCGQARKCESKCADPVCNWQCTPDTSPEACPAPACSLKCETPSFCTLDHKEPTLREVYHGYHGDPGDTKVQDALHLGKEVAWKGLAKVPAQEMRMLVPEPVVGSLPITGSQPVEGAIPMGGSLCPSCAEKVDCDCQEQEAKIVTEQVNWVTRGGPTPHPYAVFK